MKNVSKPLDKFDPRADKCLFIGYPQGQKGWKVYNLQNNAFHTSRDIFFYEDIYPSSQEPNPFSTNTHNKIVASYIDDEELHHPQCETVASLE